MKNNLSWIRTIYLYLFSLVGLILLIMGTVNFLDMGLKAFVFTEADQDQMVYRMKPTLPSGIDKQDIEKIQKTNGLSGEQKDKIDNWLKDYERWEEKQEEYDPVTSRRHEEAAQNLALILVGLPVFLYHWRIVRKEEK